jgi:amino acid adenylation domain-containing protein
MTSSISRQSSVEASDLPVTSIQDTSPEQRLAYWRERVRDLPPAAGFPTDRPRAPLAEFRSARELLCLSRDLSRALEELVNQEHVQLSTLLCGGCISLLARYISHTEVVIGCTTADDNSRFAKSDEQLSETVLLCADLASDPSFRDLLHSVAASIRDASKYRLPLASLIKGLGPEHQVSSNPAFRVLFSAAPSISTSDRDWSLSCFRTSVDTVSIDLEIQARTGPAGIVLCFGYRADLFDRSTILRLTAEFETLLRGSVAHPDVHISKLPILSWNEQQRLLVEWNDTATEYPEDRCLQNLFESQVSRTPDATALIFEDHQLSYIELNHRANRLANYLVEIGVGPESLVGICTERCLDMIVGLLGILKAGGAYVPLDPQYPSDRLAVMIEDSRLGIVVTQKDLVQKFSAYNGRFVCLDSETLSEQGVENCHRTATPDNLAYVIYTSGSTGKPKGVQICHRSVVNFLISMKSSPGLTPEDTVLAVTTISFDIAALELYLPLIVGARLVLASRETAQDGYKLRSTLESKAITVMQATPATWRLLLEAGWQGGDNLKVLCGGEALPGELAVELLNRSSSVWNMYGPTETTIWSTISKVVPGQEPIAIGKPIANTEVYVLDRNLQPVPLGVAGELYIGGDGLARGYLRRPELTSEKFIPHPFNGSAFRTRLYRTGDLARFRANGDLECLGRTDNQVKVRGFRIELGEIETALARYPGVKQNVVVAREDTPGDKRLVAYLTVHPGQSFVFDALREYLRQRLPEYMLPSHFEILKSLPLTPNGKIDRKALPKPKGPQLSEKKRTAPRGSVESQLAKIWETVLGLHSVGVQENFFEIGGHSLLAAKLLRRIEQTFGKKLSMATIFEAPTVEQLAAALCSNTAARWPSAVIPIQRTGSRPPLFCFGYGVGPVFRPLAQRLGPDQPLMAIDPTLLPADQFSAPYEMEDVASCLAKQIHEVHSGPYCLTGLCGGGLVAYEVARQLVMAGHQVSLLALVEPHTPFHLRCLRHPRGFGPQWLMERVKFHFENIQHIIEGKEAGAYIRDHLADRYRVYSYMLKKRFRNTLSRLRPASRKGPPTNIREILYTAYCAYRPQPFTGRVALLQAAHREPGSEWETQYWTNLIPPIELHEVPGYSNWVVRFFVEPNVKILASRLSSYLS